MNLSDFSDLNRRRCEAPNGFNHALLAWSPSDWMTATMGELGEAANNLKKLNRLRDNVAGRHPSQGLLKEELSKELADTFVYLDLLAQSCGIDLERAVIKKWNEVSERVGFPHRLPSADQ